jgi:hypothetical protein
MKRFVFLLLTSVIVASMAVTLMPEKASAQTNLTGTLAAPVKIVAITNNDGTLNSDTDCTASSAANPFAWIVCPVVSILGSVLDTTYNELIYPLLVVPPIPLPGQGGNNDKNAYKETYQIWSNFRLIGNVLLIIVLLVVVFGESIGGGLIDAYTVKKILPRLLIGAVLINLSIYIVAFGIDVTNVVGAGLGNLLQAPFPDSAKQLNFNNNSVLSGGTAGNAAKGTLAIVGTFAALGAAVAAFEWVLLAIILVPTLLVFFITVVVLMIRSGLIMLLVYTAPVAFALWCLPNTEQYFKKWWSLLFRTLLIFPIVALLFALGNIVSYTVGRAIPDQTLGQFLKVIGIFAPFYLIPFSFQFAGGVIAGAAGLLNKRVAKPAMGRLNKAGQAALAKQRLPQALDRSKIISGGLNEKQGGVRGGMAKLSNKTIGNARAVVKGKGLIGRIASGKKNIATAAATREEELAKKSAGYREMMKDEKAVTLAAMSGGTISGARDWMRRSGNTGSQWESALATLQANELNTALASVALKEGVAADGFKALPGLDAKDAKDMVAEASTKLSPGDGGASVRGAFTFNAKSGERPELGFPMIKDAAGNDTTEIDYVAGYKVVGSEVLLRANPESARKILDEIKIKAPELIPTLKNDAAEIQGKGVKPETAEYISRL